MLKDICFLTASIVISVDSVSDSPYKAVRQMTLELGEANGSCNIMALFIVLHGGRSLTSASLSTSLSAPQHHKILSSAGNSLLVESDKNSMMSDFATLKATFDKVVRLHYSNFVGKYAIRLVSCPAVHTDALNLLAR